MANLRQPDGDVPRGAISIDFKRANPLCPTVDEVVAARHAEGETYDYYQPLFAALYFAHDVSLALQIYDVFKMYGGVLDTDQLIMGLIGAGLARGAEDGFESVENQLPSYVTALPWSAGTDISCIEDFIERAGIRFDFAVQLPLFVRDQVRYDMAWIFPLPDGGTIWDSFVDFASKKGVAINLGSPDVTSSFQGNLESLIYNSLYFGLMKSDAPLDNSVLTDRLCESISILVQFASGYGHELVLPAAIEAASVKLYEKEMGNPKLADVALILQEVSRRLGI